MSLQIIKRELAKQDLAEQAEYIRRNNPPAALRFLEAAERAFQNLAAMPGMGGLVESKKSELAGLRCWPIRGFEKHLIFYFMRDEAIDVIRVLHGARNLPAILEE